MLVLASTSPRRKELLAQLGYQFEIAAPDFEEVMDSAIAARELAPQLALGKARSVATSRPDEVVIGADVFIVSDDEYLGKPHTADNAKAMLQRLSGRKHEVVCGWAIVHGMHESSGVSSTTIWFRALLEEEIDRYVATGDPLDKAGAYGLQTGGGAFIERIDGDYSAVIGLPLSPIALALRNFAFQ